MRKISSKLPARENPDLPPEIRQLIQGTTVRVTEPNRYFAKQWRLLLPSQVEGVTEIEPNVFRLERRTFEKFASVLRSSLARKDELPQKGGHLYGNFGASDWIAWALIPACSVRGSLTEVRPPFADDDWRVVKLPPEGSESEEITTVEELGEELDSRSIAIRVDLQSDDDAVRGLVIEARGEPLFVFEELWRIDEDAPQKREVQKRADRVWRSLTQAVADQLGIEGPTRGRPRGNEGHLAAYFHDHCGLSWQQVAQRRCQQKHAHGPLCRDNYRKLADQYWKRERKKYAALAQATSTSMDAK